MKKSIKNVLTALLIAFISLFFNATIVNARCNDQQMVTLNDDASRVRITLEVVETPTIMNVMNYEEDRFMDMEVMIYEIFFGVFGITDNIYVTMTNSLTEETITILESMTTDGVFVYGTRDIINLFDYTFVVHANLDGCRGDRLRTQTVRKPIFNIYSEYEICQDLEDVPYCRKFVDNPLDVDDLQLNEAIERFLTGGGRPTPEDEEEGIIWNWIRDNYLYITIGVIVIVLITSGVIYTIRKRRSI